MSVRSMLFFLAIATFSLAAKAMTSEECKDEASKLVDKYVSAGAAEVLDYCYRIADAQKKNIPNPPVPAKLESLLKLVAKAAKSNPHQRFLNLLASEALIRNSDPVEVLKKYKDVCHDKNLQEKMSQLLEEDLKFQRPSRKAFNLATSFGDQAIIKNAFSAATKDHSDCERPADKNSPGKNTVKYFVSSIRPGTLLNQPTEDLNLAQLNHCIDQAVLIKRDRFSICEKNGFPDESYCMTDSPSMVGNETLSYLSACYMIENNYRSATNKSKKQIENSNPATESESAK